MVLYIWPVDHIIGSTAHLHVCPSLLPLLNPLSESPFLFHLTDPISAAAIYSTTFPVMPNAPFLPLLPFHSQRSELQMAPPYLLPWHRMQQVHVQHLLW